MWLGVNGVGIDTAFVYGNQRQVAQGIAAAGKDPSDTFITTKVPCGSVGSARADIASNLQQLGVSRVDLLLIHFPCKEPTGNAATWMALEEAFEAGQARAIGVSNFNRTEVERLRRTARHWPPAVNQASMSIGFHLDAEIAYAAMHNMTYMAYSPLCGGPNGSSCRHGSVMTLPSVQAAATRHAVSPAQVALKWLVQKRHPLACASWSAQYMREDLNLWEWGDLTDTEMRALDVQRPRASSRAPA